MKITSLWLLLSGCVSQQVQIDDHAIYGDLGVDGAVQEHTLFTDIAPVEINQTDWNALRLGMVCMPVKDFSQIQATVDDLCTDDSDDCTYEVEQAIQALKKTTDDIKARMRAKGISLE